MEDLVDAAGEISPGGRGGASAWGCVCFSTGGSDGASYGGCDGACNGGSEVQQWGQRRRATAPATGAVTGTATAVERQRPLYWRLLMAPQMKSALRDGDWKLLADERLEVFELYNLREDERETTDLRDREPETFERLKQALTALTAEVEALKTQIDVHILPLTLLLEVCPPSGRPMPSSSIAPALRSAGSHFFASR